MFLKLTPSELETLSDLISTKLTELSFDDRFDERYIKELRSIHSHIIFELSKLL